MKRWDPELKGKIWKKLRNIRNRFVKRHRFRIRKPEHFSKESLKSLVTKWCDARTCDDGVEETDYFNLIDNDFRGCDKVRIIEIDKKPCSITAGWHIPNSSGYYSSVGIYDYDYEGIGEISNIDDLNYLKKEKCSYVDFGGSDKSLLTFKNKFKPHDMYTTHIFSVVRNNK